MISVQDMDLYHWLLKGDLDGHRSSGVMKPNLDRILTFEKYEEVLELKEKDPNLPVKHKQQVWVRFAISLANDDTISKHISQILTGFLTRLEQRLSVNRVYSESWEYQKKILKEFVESLTSKDT